MADNITTTKVLKADNLRALRRYLQGRGVNQRTTVVDGVTYATDRITVPGMHSDDKVISIINLTDDVDVSGYLNVGGAKASVAVFTVNKGIVFTAVKAGLEGNKIDVEAIANPDGASSPLAVVIGDRDTLKGTTGHPGRTLISVRLATDASNVVLTTSANSAANVLVAVIDAMETQPAVGGNGHIVDVALAGNGSTAWTTQAIVPLTGGASFDQGPKAAEVTTNLSPYTNADIRYVARKRGTVGNTISVAYAAGGALAVAVAGSNDITVTYVIGVTTAQDVIDAVNANAAASALVVAEPKYKGTGAGSEGTDGVIETMAALPLAGGVDPGIELTVASASKKLMVSWYTRDQLDEN